jgi:ParB/RepB/Spo0J family partition protein
MMQWTVGARDGIYEVPVRYVVENVSVTNDRKEFDEEGLTELAASIGEHGLLQLPVLRPVAKLFAGRCRVCGEVGCDCPDIMLEIVAGERRTRAVRLLAWSEMPARVQEMSDRQVEVVMLMENIQRRDLTPIEEARAFKKRMDSWEMTATEFAAAIKRTPAYVHSRLLCLRLGPHAQELIGTGQLPLSHAALLVNAGLSDEITERIAQRYRAGAMDVRDVKAIIAQAQSKMAAQDVAMFDLDLFEDKDCKVLLVENWGARGAENVVVFPHPAVPAPQVGKTLETVTTVICRYADELHRLGLAEAASAVSQLHRCLVAHNFAAVGHDHRRQPYPVR